MIERTNEGEQQPALDHAEYAAEEKALVRKIDLYLLPTLWLMYLFVYGSDKGRMVIGAPPQLRTGYACCSLSAGAAAVSGEASTDLFAIAGMEDDRNLSSSQYSVGLVVFFVTYVLFEVPSNLILSRTRPSVFLPVIMVLWGIATCCMAAANSYEHLVVLRLIIGMLEAGFASGVLLLLSSWYTKNEQSKRFAVYISDAVLSGAFGGLLAGAITTGLEGVHGIRGWRWLFIVEGAATIGWAVVAHFILLYFPSTTQKFSHRERQLAEERLQSDYGDVKTENRPQLSPMQALFTALSNWRTWMLTLGYVVIVGSSTLSYFYPTLVAGLGYTDHMAQYMTVPIYVVAFVAVAITGYFCDQIPDFRGLVIAAWLSLSMACSIAVCVVYKYTARYVLLVFMAAGLWAANGLALSYASSTFGSFQKESRAVSLACINACANAAQIYGAYLFPSLDAPKYLMGFGVISGMCSLGVAVYAIAHVTIRRWPAKR